MPPVRAFVYLDPLSKNLKQQADGLKRLALIFDEIEYVVSEWWMIKEDVAADTTRYRLQPNGSLFPVGDYRPFEKGFNPLDDAELGFRMELQSWREELRETVIAFTEAGILREAKREDLDAVDPTKDIDHLRALFVEMDYKDDAFVSIQSPSGQLDYTFGRLGFVPTRKKTGKNEIHYIDFPDTIDDSMTITHTLYYSHLLSANHVFLQKQFRRELDHRYSQYREGVQKLNEIAPEVAATLMQPARFGEISFNIANELVGSRLLEQATFEQIIRFRNETNDARQRFVTRGLSEIEEMITDSPWTPAARSQMRQFVEKKLTPDIIDYNDRTRDIWRRLYGNIGVKLVKVTSAAVLSGTAASQAGGLFGNLIPNATGHSLLVLGALAGAVKYLPEFAEDLKKAIEESRMDKRSSIAYVARLAHLK